MVEQHRRMLGLGLVARVVAMGLITSCAGSASASKLPLFSGEWAYAKRCDLGHYLSLHLKQHGDRVTGDWSEGTNVRGSDGQLQGQVRGGRLYVRYCSDDGERATPLAQRSRGQKISSSWKMGNWFDMRSMVPTIVAPLRFIRTSKGKRCPLISNARTRTMSRASPDNPVHPDRAIALCTGARVPEFRVPAQ